MRKKEDFPLQKVTVKLYDGEFAQLQTLHPRIGASKVVRMLVHSHIKSVMARAKAREEIAHEVAAAL